MPSGGPFILPTPTTEGGWREVVWCGKRHGRMEELRGQIRLFRRPDGSWRMERRGVKEERDGRA